MNTYSSYLAGGMLATIMTVQAVAAPRTITLEEGQQKTWSQVRAIKRAATGDGDVVGINVVPPRGVIITAKKPGSAMVSIWEEGNKGEPATQYQVMVTPSGASARQSLGTDAQSAHINAEGTKLRLSGALSSLERHAAVEAALQSGDDKKDKAIVDGSTSAFDVQVQIDVKIVEVSRSKLRAAGFYADRYHNGVQTGISGPSNLSAFQTDPSTGSRTLVSSTGFLPKVDAFNIFRWGTNSLTVFSALESNGFAYSLAEPSLTALSGQTATFLAGGELPIPIRSGSGADSSVSVQFKEFGIRLGLTPTVLDQNRIALKVAPEVSEVDASLAVQAGGFSIPGLRVRRTETTVALGDGETFVISGLVSRQATSDIDKFPILGDIPILGAFFKSSRFDREDKELLMIATPHLVRPFAKNAKLPALPGENIRDYDPGFLHMLLIENGRFKTDDTDTGFSQ
jgi:pilus assembly protein CpaC